jgi:transposase InsO family protein
MAIDALRRSSGAKGGECITNAWHGSGDARGLKVPQETAKMRAAVAHRRLVPPASARATAPGVGLRFRRRPDTRWTAAEDPDGRRRVLAGMPRVGRCPAAPRDRRARDARGPVRHTRGPPHIRSDNGPEFSAELVRRWLEDLHVPTLFLEPGSPWENGAGESLNGKLRDELLDREIFWTLTEATILIERWRREYNTIRPHSALGYRPPAPAAVTRVPVGRLSMSFALS